MDTTLLWNVNGLRLPKSGYAQIKSGEAAPLDSEQVLKEMRQLAKQLAQQ